MITKSQSEMSVLEHYEDLAEHFYSNLQLLFTSCQDQHGFNEEVFYLHLELIEQKALWCGFPLSELEKMVLSVISRR